MHETIYCMVAKYTYCGSVNGLGGTSSVQIKGTKSFYPEDGDDMSLRNVSSYKNHMASSISEESSSIDLLNI
jgi:hypothetical protein